MKRLYLLLALCITSIVAGAQITTFNFNGTTGQGNAGISGTPQTYVVPAGVTAIGVDMYGAAGGWPCCSWSTSSSGGPRANGGRVQCTMNVTPGETLYVYVGGQGADNYNTSIQSPGGWNGGGIGGQTAGSSFCGAGGGASDIRTSTSGAYASSVLVVAGAGGGGGDFGPVGGLGGGLTGGAGGGGSACGGGQTGPSCTTGVGLGTQGQGGSCVCYSAGGGGGGWWGGNGGVVNNGAGGGGSSYTDATRCSSVTHTQGFSGATSNGRVVITELCSNPAAVVGSTGSFCIGGSTTFTDATSGGSWVSSSTSVATVSTGGVVTAVGTGTANISYVVPGGCFSTKAITVNAAPSVASLSTNAPLCAGNTLTLVGNSPANVATYLWEGPASFTGGSTASASVPGISTSGTGTYSLTVSNGTGVGCVNVYTTAVTIRTSPSAIGGPSAVCEGSTIVLTNTVAGGTWSSTNTTSATVNTSGIVSGLVAGAANISYTLSSGCSAGKAIVVNALPVLNISPSNSATVCLGSGANFTAIAPGSTFSWNGLSGAGGLSCTSCASPSIAPLATGNNAYSVTATSGAGCITTGGVTVSVNPLPSDITGSSSNVCIGTSTLLTSGSGGIWSASNSNASIGATSGLVTGSFGGAVTITYTLPNGCYKTYPMTVSSSPAAIGGTASVCEGLTTNLTHTTGGGVWGSSGSATASVNPSGVVTGVAAGNTTISYTLPNGCIVTTVATVNALPAAISGASSVCELASTTMTDVTSGGTWSSSSSNATVNPFSGIVNGATAGNAVISYTLPTGCYRTKAMTVNALPVAISGNNNVCHNSVEYVTNATPGGSWGSSNTGIAFVDPSGVVTGITPGAVTVSYTLGTGCYRTLAYTVNALPAVIDGTKSVCVNGETNLSNTDAGGTWSSSATGTATINSAGVVTGVAAGNATITYTLGTGCRRTAAVTVNALPIPISGTASVCEGAMTTLYNFSSGGTWESGAPGTASVSGTGDVTGVSAGLANITYTLPTGCARTQVVTVNALPSSISGTAQVCVGQNTYLGNSMGGGTWASSAPGVATIDGTGTVTGVAAGNTVVTYTLGNGCYTTALLTVNGLPNNITGAGTVCENASTSLTNSTPGGAWSSESDALATVSGAGSVTGVLAGNVNISYTLATGCYRTKLVVVNPLPASVSGSTQVCVNGTTQLESATPGGVWSSGAPGTAGVNATGEVSGLSAGNAEITYTISTGCRRSATVVVNPLPNNTSGPSIVCQGNTITLSNSSAGGTWESGNTSVASITSGGVVTGLNAGTSRITYTLATGCMRMSTVSVNPQPTPATGNLNVCVGLTTALGNSTTGGIWTSSTPGVATINSTSGVVTGVSAGITNITYTLPTSCRTVSSVVVNSNPASISGATAVCKNSSISVSNSTAGGSWSSSATGVAMVDGSGVVTGIDAGTARITYTLPTGCYSTQLTTVNALPAAITGNSSICQGNTMTLNNATGGGSWSSSNPAILTVSGTGVATGNGPGVAAVSYTLNTGCAQTMTINVDDLPLPIAGPNTVCVGSSVMQSTLSSGGFWSSASPMASVSFLGEVTGTAAGTVVITYMYGSGCARMKTMTVNPLPAVSAGDNAVCVGSMTTLTNSSAGGTWLSNSPAHATVDNASGMVTGVSGGMVLMSYVLPTGCQRVKTMSVNVTPAAIGGVTETCDGTTTILTNTTPGGIWTSSNTSVALADIAGGIITGMAPGTATVNYTLSTGCKSSTTVTIRSNPAAISGSTNLCAGSSAVLTNATLGGSWISADDAVATVSGAGVLSGVAAGNTTVTYMLGTGCYRTASVAVNALPDMKNVTGGGSYCAGGAGVGIGLDASQTATSYKLYRAGTGLVGSYTGTGTPMFFGTMTSAGMYTVSATNASGCTSAMAGSATIAITPVVVPMVSISSDLGDTVCAGQAVTFGTTISNGGTTPTYEWKVNGVTMSGTGSSFTHSPAMGDIISVNMTSNAECAVPAVATAVKAPIVMSVETPAANIGVAPSASVCEGTVVMFTATAVNGGSTPTYTWMKNGTTPMGGGATLTYTPADNDVITVRMNSSYRCVSVNNVMSNNITMNVDKVYVPEVQVIATPGTTIQQGDQVTFTTNVLNAGPTPQYRWLKNGLPIAGANGTTYVGSNFVNGDSVTCVVKGSGACGEETINSVMLTVIPSTGVAQTANVTAEVKLVPNPNNGVFTVSGTIGEGSEEVSLEVTDMLGQVVYRGTTQVTGGKLNAGISLGGNLANGMYLLNLHTATSNASLHFVVKQ